jgi:hypothetical protein
MRKLMCFCDRCAVPADWSLRPWKQNLRYFDLTIKCHGELEQFLVAASEFVHVSRDPSSGRDITRPLYVIAFEGEIARKTIRVIEAATGASIRLANNTNRQVRD